MKKKIAIIGAGIAGLTLANFIKKNSDYDDISASIILQSWINENIMD